uniref:Uncharacterized protein n=1 Tax=Oryza nivara TaxID=4536 RepID=A0A0E0J5J1_ORYNI
MDLKGNNTGFDVGMSWASISIGMESGKVLDSIAAHEHVEVAVIPPAATHFDEEPASWQKIAIGKGEIQHIVRRTEGTLSMIEKRLRCWGRAYSGRTKH